MNKIQWNLNLNLNIFIQENGFENVCEMASILFQPQCVNPFHADFISGNITPYLNFQSFLYTEIV